MVYNVMEPTLMEWNTKELGGMLWNGDTIEGDTIKEQDMDSTKETYRVYRNLKCNLNKNSLYYIAEK